MALADNTRCFAEIANGTLDVGPGCILREDGTDDDFETAATGPPVLRAMGMEKYVVRGTQEGGSLRIGCWRRKWDGRVRGHPVSDDWEGKLAWLPVENRDILVAQVVAETRAEAISRAR